MKAACLGLLIFFLCSESFAQFRDSFSDGDFHANPPWTGDSSFFIVNTDSILQSNGPASSGEIYLSSHFTKIKNQVWEFTVVLDFSPSSSNYAQFYLASDSSNLESDLQGYYLKLGGESGNTDAIDLYRQDGDQKERIIRGTAGLMGGDSIHARIKATRSFEGEWKLLADTSLNGTFALQGSAYDTTYSESSFIGIFCKHTSTRKDQFYFDDIEIKNGDLELVSCIPLNEHELELQFSSNLAALFSQDSIELILDGIPIEFHDIRHDTSNSNRIHISLDSAMIPGDHILEVWNIQDDQENILDYDSAHFLYLPFPGLGDIIINEIMADPEPQVGLPKTEYVEIFNAGSEDFKLSQLVFSDGKTSSSLGQGIIQKGEYVILCKEIDTIDYKYFGHAVGLDPWPSLNNGGDTLEIRLESGKLLDAVQYSENWHQNSQKKQGGWSLERINPFRKCSDEFNWSSSVEGSGGTPGFVNSIYDDQPDVVPPGLTHIEILSDYQIVVHFDEAIDSQIESPEITILPEIPIQWSELKRNSLSITFTNFLDSGNIYQISLDSIIDCEDNLAFDLNSSFGLGRVPEVFELLITEIMADPEPIQNLPKAEYIELHNASTEMISLNELYLISEDDTFDLPDISIKPKEYIVLCQTNFVDSFHNALPISPWPGLKNDSDHLMLEFFGNYIFEVTYNQSWMDDKEKEEGGWSLEMIDKSNPCGENDNWTASIHSSGGSPGYENSMTASNPDLSKPEIMDFLFVDSNQLALHFNESIDLHEMTPSNFTITDNEIVEILIEKRFQSKLLQTFESNFEPGIDYRLSASQLGDCVSNYSFNEQITFTVPELPDSGDLLINEVLFQPYSGGSEFVELINSSQKVLNLRNLSLSTYDEEGSLKEEKTITHLHKTLEPGEILLIAEDTQAISNFYMHHDKGAFFQMDGFPSLTNDEGIITLLDSTGRKLDSLHYSDKMHFELISNTKGVSLEKISLDISSAQQNNWISAAESWGFASPGIQNSNRFTFSEPEYPIEIYPPIFSPDGDGFNDQVHIKINSGNDKSVLNMNVFNTTGMHIKELANNVSLGIQNTFIWNGIDDNGRMVSIGNYILLVEIFDSAGNTKKVKKLIALGGRI